MRRLVLGITACILSAALSVSAVLWFNSGSGTSPSDPGQVAYRTNQQVTMNSIVYGLEKISTPRLDAMGIKCVPAPTDTTYGVEEWPDSDPVPDPAHREALSPELREVYDCMMNCLPADPTHWDGPSLNGARACFESIVLELTAKVGLVDTFAAVGALLRTYPKITFFCHKAGHGAGEAAVAAGIDMKTAIVAVGDYCVHGAIHGIFDGFAKKSPGLDDFREMAQICAELKDSASGGCTDGMGHAAWDTFQALGPSADACGTIEQVGLRYSCDEGVLMRRYERQDPGLITTPEEYKAFTKQLREDCATWAATATQRDNDAYGPGTGCYSGVQYMLWLYPTWLARDHQVERWRAVPDFQAYLDELVATCASFGPGGNELCRGDDGNAVAVVADYKTEDFEVLCKMLGGDVAACVKQAFDLTNFNSGQVVNE